jgi:2-iminoacetate synthase
MINIPSFAQLTEQLESCTGEDVQRSLRADHLNISDLAALLSPAADTSLESMAKRSAEITARRFGKTTQIYAPLYLSSFCTNRCSYCGFSADNKIERRLLSLDEAESEAMLLHERGFNHILLVSGEAPAKLGASYLEELVLRLRDRFAAISIEVQPLSTEEYTRLFNAGITAVAIYQETYDRGTYNKVHLSGQKCDYNFRLDTPARAASSGMREVGIGTLLGLADWRAEGLALGMHLAWLRKHFWKTGLTISFPRLRPAAGEFQPLSNVSERDLSHLIFALRIFDPDVGIILSTREEARYRNGMIGLGPTRYSAGSCTAPGGYSNPEITGEQFSIGDHRPINEVCAAIKQKGYDPVRKDWDAGFQLAD